MSVLQLPPRESFRVEPAIGLPSSARVDFDKRVIYGAKVMQLGALQPGDQRPWKVDSVTLSQLETLINQRNRGTKMRFAHPNMSRDGMGRHIGRATNARLAGEGDQRYVAVDAHLNAMGGLRTQEMVEHVLDLAQSAPEDFGLSVAPLLDHEAMGKIEPDENGLVPIRLKSLTAIDFVDEPAATDGLFSLDSGEVADLPAQATHLLDTFFAGCPGDVIRDRFGEFLNRYLANRGNTPMADKNAFTVEEDVVALKAEIEALKAEIAAMKEEEPSEPAQPSTEQAPEGMSKELVKVELQRRSEITALCKLAKVPDADRDLMIAANFSRAEAQDYLRASGQLSASNPPVSEGSGDLPGKKPTQEEEFGLEWDNSRDLFTRQGVSRDAYIKSRLRDVK